MRLFKRPFQRRTFSSVEKASASAARLLDLGPGLKAQSAQQDHGPGEADEHVVAQLAAASSRICLACVHFSSPGRQIGLGDPELDVFGRILAELASSRSPGLSASCLAVAARSISAQSNLIWPSWGLSSSARREHGLDLVPVLLRGAAAEIPEHERSGEGQPGIGIDGVADRRLPYSSAAS